MLKSISDVNNQKKISNTIIHLAHDEGMIGW